MYRIIVWVFGVILSVTCFSQEQSNSLYLYVGTFNTNPDKGIECYDFDTFTGELNNQRTVAKLINPSFQYIEEDSAYLFSVSNNNPDSSKVVCYKINERNGSLNKLSEASSNGQSPCYVSYSSIQNSIYVANYLSGNVSQYGLNNGVIQHIKTVSHYGTGPHPKRQNGPHAHSVNFDSNSNYIYSADLGADKMMIYENISGEIEKVDSIICKSGSGPRHFDFSPDGQMMVLANEMSASITAYKKDNKGIYKKEFLSLSLLPDTFKGKGNVGDIHFSPDGKFLYVSTRGFNSIVVIKINGKSMELVEWETEGINWPRNFGIDPSGKFLLVANQKANTVTVYRRDPIKGILTKLDSQVNIERPVCLSFFSY
jgi:6-phosphogluconolactonase